jgi:branched-chain amino acid transport system substrate-binding protein
MKRAALLLPLLLGAASAQEVVIGWSGAATGPTSDAGRFVFEGVTDYCRYVNDEGLLPGGATLRCLINDDAYDNNNTLRNFEAYLDEGMVAFISYSTGATLQLKVNAVEEEMPVLSASYHIGVIEPPDNEYNFLPITTYSEQLLALMEYVAENHEGEEPVRVAILSHPSPFGRDPVTDARAAAELLGIEIVDVQEHGEATDYTAMLQRWSSQGVQYVLGQTVESPVAAMLNAAQALGLFDTMTFMGAHYTGGATLTDLAGDAAEGYIWATSYFVRSDEDAPGMALQREIGERYGRSETTIADVNYTTGLMQVAIYAEAARRVLERGDEVTSATMYEALLAMNDDADGAFDPGFAVGPISFSDTDRVGVDALRLLQVQEGEFVAITEPFNSETFAQVHPRD